MGEFVGLDPGKARRLIRRMDDAAGLLAAVRPLLQTAIDRAGADWAGSGGTAALHRARAFLVDSQQELRWRIETITRLHPGWDGDGGLLTARFPFTTEGQAATAGTRAGAAIAAAFEDHLGKESADSQRTVEAALAAARTGARDPAFAAALLAAIGGPAAYRRLFGKWMDANAGGPRRGPSPKALEKAEKTLDALAEAFAAADAAGRLDKRWRDELLGKANPATLSAMIALARQSGAFLNRAAMRVLQPGTSGFRPDSPDPDWNTHALIKAYEADPLALQRLLAEWKEAPALLLRPGLAKGTMTPGFEKMLATTLDKALNARTGDPFTRQSAWQNLFSLAAEGARERSNLYTTLRDSPINAVLAKNVVQYLDQLAADQVKANNPKLRVTAPPGWTGVDTDTAARFFGAVMQDAEVATTLTREFRKYLFDLDIGKAHPFSADPAERAEFVHLSARGGGLANLLLGGSTYAELSDDQYAEAIADITTLPADIALNALKVGPGTATGIGYLAGGPKDKIADLIKDYFDENIPDTASMVAERIVRNQMESIIESLEKHKKVGLTLEDQAFLQNSLRGQLYPALIKALENRGG